MKALKPVLVLAMTGTLCAAGAVSAQDPYRPYGNGAVVIVPANPSGLPYSPGYGYGGSAVVPYGNSQGVVVTPQGAVPYGRYNRDAARESFRINNALGGARAANDAAAQAQQPLTPLNPMPGNLR